MVKELNSARALLGLIAYISLQAMIIVLFFIRLDNSVRLPTALIMAAIGGLAIAGFVKVGRARDELTASRNGRLS
jgi:hypothetical protein